jgi:hypothetical protein
MYYIFEGIPVGVNYELVREAKYKVRHVHLGVPNHWPVLVDQYFSTAETYDPHNMLESIRNQLGKTKDRDYVNACSANLTFAYEFLCKARNNYEIKNWPALYDNTHWLGYVVAMIVALLNRRWYKGRRTFLEDYRSFRNLPASYTRLMKTVRGCVTLEPLVVITAAEKLWANTLDLCTHFGARPYVVRSLRC